MKKYIALLVLLVFLAGCVGSRPVKVDANNGLKINEFSVDPPVAEQDDNVLFTVAVENVGGTTAEGRVQTDAQKPGVALTLIGIDGIWRRSPGGVIIDGKQSADKDLFTSSFNDDAFEPPVSSQNRPGDLKFSTKTLMPPVLTEGVEQDFPVTARVTYKYSTSGSIIVPTISRSLLKIKTDKGESVDSAARITNSDGPLKIGLSKGTLPIVVDDKKGSGTQEATFVIEIVNVGDGFPVTTETTNGVTTAKLGQLTGKIRVFGAGVTFDSSEGSGCLGFKPTNPANTEITFTKDADLLKLRSTGRLPLSCTIKIDRSAFSPTTSGIITFSLDMSYGYFVEKTVNVHVIGAKTEGTPKPAADTIKVSGLVSDTSMNAKAGVRITIDGGTCTNYANKEISTTNAKPKNYDISGTQTSTGCMNTIQFTIPNGYAYGSGLTGCKTAPSAGATGVIRCEWTSEKKDYVFNVVLKAAAVLTAPELVAPAGSAYLQKSEIGDNGLKLEWRTAAGAKSYKYEIKQGGERASFDGQAVDSACVDASSTSAVLAADKVTGSDGDTGTTYYWRVTAYADASCKGNSVKSDTISFTVS